MTGLATASSGPIEANSGLRLEHLGSPEALEGVRDEWDGFVERSGSDI